MGINGDEERSYGQDSRSGGSSSSDLEDIENELYSRIYYRSSEATGSTSFIDADASAQAAVDSATAAVLACPARTDEKANGDIVVVSNDASEGVKEEVEPRSCSGTEAGRQAAVRRPRRLGRQAAALTAAAATVDLTCELDEHSRQIELGDLSPDEYVVLSSADEDDLVVGSRVRPSHRSAKPQPLDSSNVTIESDDDSGDQYEINDSCNFEFNRLAQTPRSTTAFFGTLRDVLASLPPHSWRISDADIYPDSFRSRYYNTRCKRCNEKGHAVRDCRKPVKPPSCIQCGMQGHVQWSCKRQLCINCGQFGHVLSTCTLKHRKLLYCKRCHRRGHLDEVCSELWRQFHWVTKPEAFKSVSCKPPRPVGINKVRYCANCGLRGHFLHDCKALQPNPFRPAPSVFVNVYRNDSARCGGTPNVKASRKAVTGDSIVSASAVRPARRRSLTETGLTGDDDDVYSSPVSKKRSDGRLGTPTAAATANESHLASSGRKRKRRLRVEPLDARNMSFVASISDVNAADGRSPGTSAISLATGGRPNGETSAPVRITAAAAAELEAASSTAMPPWEQHASSPGDRRVSSPLKRPWLYDRSPAGVQHRGASADLNDIELLPSKRRSLLDSHSTGLDRGSFSASKTPDHKKSGLAAKSRLPSERESDRTAELRSGGKKYHNPGKSPAGKQPGRVAKRKASGQQPLQQRQHQQPQQQRQHQQQRQKRQHKQPQQQRQHQQPLQQQQRQHQQHPLQRQQWQQQQRQHHQQELKQQQQQQQHRQQQLQQPPHQQRQHQNHQQQHQQRHPQQQKQRQKHDGSTMAAGGHHSATSPREHYPSQGQRRQYWPTTQARGGGGKAQATSQSYQVVKHGDFTGHYYRSGSEMVVKFDY